MNMTIQKTIGKSPAEVIFGFKLTRELEPKVVQSTDREIIIKEIQEKQRNVKYKDKNTINRLFEIGDKVLIKQENRTKEDDRYVWPYNVVNKIHGRSYTLQDGTGTTLVRNIEWLIPFKEGGCEDIIN